MRAHILTIGDELLIGQVINTNSSWIAEQLNLSGIHVAHMSTVSDTREDILSALEQSLKFDFVFITGGLGPTKDDITKQMFSEFFERKLVTDENVLKDVTEFFAKRGVIINELNRRQALVPEGCFVIRNKNGTAPGMWMQKQNTIFISMPGVPFEMKVMVSEDVIPKIRKEFDLPFIYHKTVLTQGIGEGILAEKIEAWEDALAAKNIKLAYLPQPGIVRLRLSTSGKDQSLLKKNVDEEIKKLSEQIGQYIYGFEEFGAESETLEKVVSQWLRETKQSISLAESCTGGYISSLFTAIPGASDIFKGAIVPYTNQAKHELLNVDEKIFEQYGAVSSQCVELLAKHVREKFGSDLSIAISGIAGPTGGTPEKPVGTVWVAIADNKNVYTKKFLFVNNRQRNIVMTAQASLKFLLDKFRENR
jgi:nicotinamide-nucleotide amidase